MPSYPAFKTKPYYDALKTWLTTALNEDGTLKSSAVQAEVSAAIAAEPTVVQAAADAVDANPTIADHETRISDNETAASHVYPGTAGSGGDALSVDDAGAPVWVPNRRIFDVTHPRFGAACDGATNDLAAIQAAIDAATATGGSGTIFIPWTETGTLVNGTLTKPIGKPLTILGGGMGGATNANRTRIFRTGGLPFLQTAGTGTTGATVDIGLTIRDVTFDGGGTAGNVINLVRSQTVVFENVRIYNATNFGLYAQQLWNSRFSKCHFEMLGSSSTGATAVKLTCADDNSATNTVSFVDCIWEQNLGGDVWLGGERGANTAYAELVRIVGGKIERAVSGPNAHAEPLIYLQRAHGVVVTGCNLVGGTGPHIKQDAGFGNVFSANDHLGTMPVTGSTAYSTVFVDIVGANGPVSITGNTFRKSTTAHVRIGAGVTGEIIAAPNGHERSGSNEKYVDDQRATKNAMAVDGTMRLRSLDDGTTNLSLMDFEHVSASPAVGDVLGIMRWLGRDSAGNTQEYGRLYAIVLDTTDGSEDARYDFRLVAGGSVGTVAQLLANGGTTGAILSLGTGKIRFGTTPDGEDVYLARKDAGVIETAANHSIRSGRGATGSRPSASTAGAGAVWYDTTLGKPIWSNGTNWTDATGAVV